MKTLKVSNIHYHKILKGVNLDWRQGEIIALMGLNGSGKSTLARLLVGLIDPEQGDINMAEDGLECPWEKIRRWQEIGLVGQHPMRQTIGVTVAEELAFGLLNLGLNSRDVRTKVKELASAAGLSGKEDQSPATLSGGERQRLVTVAILALQPSFLIIDEGLTMLDARAQTNMLSLLKQIRTETGQLWITHDPELAQHADRLLVLDQGILVDRGCPSELFSQPAKRFYDLSTVLQFKQPSGLESSDVSKQEDINRDTELGAKTSDIAYLNDQMPADTGGSLNAMIPPVLEWKQTDYDGRLQLEKAVGSGEFIGIVGPSGSGKTTLLESAIGLILPTEGKIYSLGERLSKESISKWRKTACLVMQEAGEYLIGRTAYHEIYYEDTRQELKAQKANRLVYLARFGLTPAILDSEPEQLSGGVRQRVALAAALRRSPQVLLLDEPLLGLDIFSRKEIQDMISNLKKTTILYVTHDLRDILKDADRIWLVEHGRIVLDCAKQNWRQYLEQFEAAGVRC